mgnify:CR=1 FL=1
MDKRKGVDVMDTQVNMTQEGQVSVIYQDSETVFRRLGHDLI